MKNKKLFGDGGDGGEEGTGTCPNLKNQRFAYERGRGTGTRPGHENQHVA